ncbi:hypothetical protein BJ170DRAFT_730966 [Xylariales sp. AK1849]|nr:hypothetical protein BJ170DRAFT_730966 [Xylariales sp. AK1849]
MDGDPKARWASLRGLMLIFISIFLLLPDVISSPTPDILSRGEKNSNTAHSLAKRYSGKPSGKVGTGGPATSDYPSDDQIRSAFTNPSGPYVFFAQIGDSTTAYNFAQSKGGNIFRQAFPRGYTNENKRSAQWHQDFADRFSGVFAEKASGDVYVVSTWNFKIDDCRVWSRIEFPTLKDNSKVESVILVDYTNWKNQKVIWAAEGLGAPFARSTANNDRRAALEAENALQKRATYCFDWDGYGDDPGDPDHGTDTQAYVPGWCGVHVTQYQKNEGPGGNTADYRFDVTLYDANQEEIGSASLLDVPSGQTRGVDSALPFVFEITAGNVDNDAVLMAYAGQNFGSNDQEHHCNFGKYDSGSRNGDCGFSC